MLDSFLVVLGSVISLFLMMSVGFFFARKKLLSQESISQISRLLLYVVTPCIMVDLFQTGRTAETDRQMLTAGAALAATYGLYMLLDLLLFRKQPPRDRGVLRFASMYGNKGFMGLPLIQASLGDEAAMVAALALGVFNVVSWTHGYAVIGGREKLSLRKAALNPATIGFAVAILLYLTGWRLPGPVSAAVGYLGSLNTPLAMIIIGGQMAGADLLSVFRDKRGYLVSFFKLAAMPLVTMLALLPFRLDETTYMALVILSGCPSAGVTALFSQMLDRDTALAARLVTFSTLICIVTLPLAALAAELMVS